MRVAVPPSVVEQSVAGRRRGLVSPADVVDVFVYVVVLNLAVQFLPAVITESFTMSLFTAVVLKIVLEVVVAIKKRVRERFRTATSRPGKIGAALLLWALLIGSKFVVLELVAIIFRGRSAWAASCPSRC